jgi:hypothetical protein
MVFLKLRKRIINSHGFEQTMFENDSNKLVDSLEKHVADYFNNLHKHDFIAHLRLSDSVARGCYFRVKDDSVNNFEQMQKINSNSHHSLKLKYLIFNKVIADYAMSKALAVLASLANLCPPEILSIRSTPAIMEIMKASVTPDSIFSLIGEYSLNYYGGDNKTLYVSNRPVLVVPGAENHETICHWESNNKKYYKESNNPFSKNLVEIRCSQFPNTVMG